MNSSNSLENKVALITSSSPGTCADVAKQLAAAGTKVVICGRNANQGLATVRQIRQAGGRATFILADIAVIADVRAMIDEAIATYGRLDILLNDVSNSYAQDAPMPDVSESVWDRIIEPLLKGTFFCCQLSIPFLQQNDGGTIINIVEKTPGLQGRSVSKICQGGVVAMTSAIAQQFTNRKVTANLIWATPLATIAEKDAVERTNTSPNELAPNELAPNELAPDESDLNNSDPNESDSNESQADSIQIGLLIAKTLTGPVGADTPFADIGEAVMYLAQKGLTLDGTALYVHTAESGPESRSESRSESGPSSESSSSSSTKS